MHERFTDLQTRIVGECRRHAEFSQHVHRIETTLRDVADRLYLLRARHLCLNARFDSLRERLGTIEEGCRRLGRTIGTTDPASTRPGDPDGQRTEAA